MRNCQIPVVRGRSCTYHMGEITGNTLIYIQKWLVIRDWTEWMKGMCHTWSRGRHFSPSLPGDRYLNLGAPKKRPPGRNLGEHRLVRSSGATSRGTALILLFLCKWCVFAQVQLSSNYFIRPLCKTENGYFQNLLKSSHFSIIWSFWVTNPGFNTLCCPWFLPGYRFWS